MKRSGAGAPAAGTAAALSFERPATLQATSPPEARGLARDGVRLLVTTPGGHEHAVFHELPRFLGRGTLVVVNRSATLPVSLPAYGRSGPFILNLSTRYGAGLWLAEPRRSASEPGRIPLEPGERIEAGGLDARIVGPFPGLGRLWFVRLHGDVEAAMVARGSPIRYGYLEPPFPALDAYQTIFAAVPGSAEMPSAGRPFTGRTLEGLDLQGVRLASIVLHAGVSSLEVDPEHSGPLTEPGRLEHSQIVEQVLYPEPFHVPAETADAVNTARAERRPVVAVGTTVVRALESAWDGGRVRPVAGFTRRFVNARKPVRAVDGLLTGLHEPFATHLAMLHALAEPELIRSSYEEAARAEYLWHEFGDSQLLLPSLDDSGESSAL